MDCLKKTKFDKIQAIHPQNIIFFHNKSTNKLSIELAFFNDVNSKKILEIETPSLLGLNEKKFEHKWKSIIFHLGDFFFRIISCKKFTNKHESISDLQEMNLDKELIQLFEAMFTENLEKRISIEELIKNLEESPLIKENDLDFLQNFRRNENKEKNGKNIRKSFPEIYEILFHFNKAINEYEKLLEISPDQKIPEDSIEIMTKIAQNYLCLTDHDKCNKTCYKALNLFKTEKKKTEKSKWQFSKFKLNLMNGISLMALGLPEKSVGYLEEAFKFGEQIKDFNPFAQVICILYLCDNQKTLGKFNKALSLNEKSLELLKKIKEDSTCKKKLMIEFLLNFSQTYLMMENFPKALEFCNDALIYQERNFPEFHPFLKQCFVQMANLNFLQGFYEKAANNFEYALNINSKIFPPYHETFIDLNYDLGTVSSKTDSNPQNVLKYFEQALELFYKNSNVKKSPKEKKEQFSLIHSSIARAYYSLNKFDKAIEFFQKALNLDKELYPELGHLRIVEENLLLGNSYSCLSNYEMALKNCEEALKLGEKLLPETDEKMVDILFDIGDVCNNLKRVESGVIYYERIIKIYEKNKKIQNDNKIFEVFLAISSLYLSLGNIDQAIKALIAGQQKYKAINKGEYNDPIIINVLNSMGSLYSSTNAFDKSAKYYNESLELAKKCFPHEEKHILDALIGLAVSYFNLENFEKAIKHFQEALEIKEKKKENGANVGDLCTNLGYAFKALKNIEEAKKYFEKAVKYYKDALPKNHKDLISAIETLKSLN